MEYVCVYCGKQCKNKNSLVQHEIRCKENPDRIVATGNKIVWTEERKKEHSRKIKEGIEKSDYIPGQQLTDEVKAKISKSSKEHHKKYWTEENRKKHSEAMKRAVKNNPDSYSASNVSGRTKTIEYNGFKLKGAWELSTAIWLDENDIKWTNEVNGFNYKWDGSIRNYFPDFYLPEKDLYIEVKGNQRERDICKWNDFPKRLVVLKKDEIEKIQNKELTLDYILDKQNHWEKVDTKRYLEEQAKELKEKIKKPRKTTKGYKHTEEAKRKISQNNGARLSDDIVKTRKNDYLCIEKKDGWAKELASKWNLTENSVRRFVKVYC